MCLVKVKEEEDINLPSRYKKTRRVTRTYTPPRSVRVSRVSIQERRPSPVPPPRSPSPPPTRIVAPSIRSPSRGPSVYQSRTTRITSRPPSRARSAYVEVDESTSSSSSSEEDVKSRTTHKSHRSKSSQSRAPRPPSSVGGTEYSVHEREKEIRRDYARPRSEYATYQYVEAPERRRSQSRRSGYGDPRASGEDYRQTRITIHDERDRRREYNR